VIAKLQKGSLAVLLWFAIYVYAWQWIFDIVWPRQVHMAGYRNNTLPIDVPLPIPLMARLTMFAIPTMVVGSFVFFTGLALARSIDRWIAMATADRRVECPSKAASKAAAAKIGRPTKPLQASCRAGY
jgi:hypothetical protein